MAEQSRVSIVTPSYNQADFLEATIQSVLALDYPEIEYIIIDGGSTDGSVEIIEKYAGQLAYWVSEPDQGQTEAINKGFAQATGKYLAWLNADDLLKPQAVAEAVAFLEGHRDVAMVYGEADYINEHGQVLGQFPAAQTDYGRLLRGYVHVPQQAAFWRRAAWEDVGPLDPDYYFAMDYDLWVRLARISRLVYLPGHSWAQFRLHSASKTLQDDMRCWPEMLRVHRREGGSWFSIITFKYYLRRLLAPLLVWRRKRLMQGPAKD